MKTLISKMCNIIEMFVTFILMCVWWLMNNILFPIITFLGSIWSWIFQRSDGNYCDRCDDFHDEHFHDEHFHDE